MQPAVEMIHTARQYNIKNNKQHELYYCHCHSLNSLHVTFRRLDYDRRVSHSYNFTIIASDNGVPSHRGSANVRVSVTNVNDEDPVFVQPVEHVLLVGFDLYAMCQT